jgi:prepilin-type N-terminal cleavage/methylation domain-containing protein
VSWVQAPPGPPYKERRHCSLPVGVFYLVHSWLNLWHNGHTNHKQEYTILIPSFSKNRRYQTRLDNTVPAGFTIVEITIVIGIIAILTVIGSFAYAGIQNKTYDSTVQSDLRNLSSKIDVFKSKKSRYPSTAVELQSLDARRSPSALLNSQQALKYCLSATAYAVGMESKSGNGYFYSSATRSFQQRSAPQTNDWCNTDYGIAFTYAAWTTPTEDWSGSRSSNGS